MNLITSLQDAYTYYARGKVLAYPTESVYGLGCDPFNQSAVEKVLALKQRTMTQGLILLISDWTQLAPLIDKIPEERMNAVRKTWPGPVTWVFPKSSLIPIWLSGDKGSIAIRMTAHPLARTLCAKGPLVSTSANRSGQPPAMNMQNLIEQFPKGIDGVVEGQLGDALRPSSIYDVLTGDCFR